MIIGLASDHAGYSLKEHIASSLKENYILKDYGCSNSTDSVDYPNFAEKLCQELLRGEIEKGILICGSGIGMSIAANRHKGIRAALCQDLLTARLSREHNNANVLCLGNWLVTSKLSDEILDIWLNTNFAGGRHIQRLEMLN